MKKILYRIILLGVVAVTLFGCEFLNVEEPGKNDIPKFFSNMDGMRMANYGMYNELLNVFDGNYTRYAEAAGDLFDISSNEGIRDQHNFKSKPENRNTAVDAIWRYGYSALTNINNILIYGADLKEALPNDAAEIDHICADALFGRALVHLALCNVYAQPYNFTPDASHLGIPVTTRPARKGEKVARNRVKEVYKRIMDDLDAAIAIYGEPKALPIGTDWSYYATAHACKALQARVSLYMGNYETARDCATVLIDMMQLTPYRDYVAMCQSHDDAKPGIESIFKLSAKGLSGRSMYSFFEQSGSGEAAATVSSKLLDMFYDNTDIRKVLIDGRITDKYRSPKYDENPIPETINIPYGLPVLRLTEMYLIRAEANYNLGEYGPAVEDLKAIIGRATDTPATDVTLTYSSPPELLDIIARERCLELYGEGHRFFDIVRWKQSLERAADTPIGDVTYMKYPNDLFVLPIPHDETSVNDAIIQNPGYVE